MARVPEARREDLSPAEQPIFDHIVETRGGARGPFAVLLHHPPLAERVAAVGEMLRFHGDLPGSDRELAILTAGREVESQYEWHAHEPIAHREGTSAAAIETVRDRNPTSGLTQREALIIDTVRALYRDHHLSDAHYARAEAELGRRGLLEVVAIAGYYGTIGFVLNAFEVGLPAGATPGFKRGT